MRLNGFAALRALVNSFRLERVVGAAIISRALSALFHLNHSGLGGLLVVGCRMIGISKQLTITSLIYLIISYL